MAQSVAAQLVAAQLVAVTAWLLALSHWDVRTRRLPNRLTLPGAVLIPVAAGCQGRGAPAVAGMLALFGVYLAVHLMAAAALGAGDVKLAAGVGALTGAFGADVWAVAAVAAPLLTCAWALVAALRRARTTVPHGLSMCVATAGAVTLALV